MAVFRKLPLIPIRPLKCLSCNRVIGSKLRKILMQKENMRVMSTCPKCGQVHIMEKNKSSIVMIAKEYIQIIRRRKK